MVTLIKEEMKIYGQLYIRRDEVVRAETHDEAVKKAVELKQQNADKPTDKRTEKTSVPRNQSITETQEKTSCR